MTCATYWGSHGCRKQEGHRGGHVCCCDTRLHWLIHWLPQRLAPGWWPWSVPGCVGRWPYYGRITRFY